MAVRHGRGAGPSGWLYLPDRCGVVAVTAVARLAGRRSLLGRRRVSGAGGTVAASIGVTEFAGGAGGTSGSGTTQTGAGGGGAGSTGAGGNASANTAGTAGNGGGGAGGAGTTTATGGAGTAPGGGGGSTSSSTGTGGAGARGQVRYTITPNAAPATTRRRPLMLVAA